MAAPARPVREHHRWKDRRRRPLLSTRAGAPAALVGPPLQVLSPLRLDGGDSEEGYGVWRYCFHQEQKTWIMRKRRYKREKSMVACCCRWIWCLENLAMELLLCC
ncbi:unnamed protein product [Urochloa humidicola]